MSKFKKIILTILIALLGIVFEVLNYYIFALNDRLHKIGIATAGWYIIFISFFGNILFYYYLDKKKGK